MDASPRGENDAVLLIVPGEKERSLSLHAKHLPVLEQCAPADAVCTVHLFRLPRILPDHARLLLDTQTNSALVLSLNGAELTASAHSSRLTPSTTRLLFCLLQAYPHTCSYHDLFLALSPRSSEPGRAATIDHDLLLRPVRRALLTLVPTLRGLGLRAIAVRSQGYVLGKDEQRGVEDDAL